MVTMNFPDEMLLVLSRIGWYASEHKWAPEEVQRVFEAGIAARTVLASQPGQVKESLLRDVALGKPPQAGKQDPPT